MPGAKSFHVYSGGGDDDRRGGHGGGGGRGGLSREPMPEHRRVRTVFIHNMSPDMGEGDLIRLVMPFGDVEKVNYLWYTDGEKKGQPRGFATVEFKYV